MYVRNVLGVTITGAMRGYNALELMLEHHPEDASAASTASTGGGDDDGGYYLAIPTSGFALSVDGDYGSASSSASASAGAVEAMMKTICAFSAKPLLIQPYLLHSFSSSSQAVSYD